MTACKTVTIVIPVFNESACLKPLVAEIKKATHDLDGILFKLLFVDDGSSDDTLDILMQLADQDPTLQVISLSRNFGNQVALSAGIRYVDSDAIITMDGDLQHPPSVIPNFITQWQAGYEVVISKRNNYRPSLMSRIYFWLLGKISQVTIDQSISDYRLLDRVAYRSFNRFSERHRFVRAMVDWIGFKRTVIEFDVGERMAGTTSFSLTSLFSLGMRGLTSFSLFPLKIAFILGILILLGSGLLLVYMIGYRYVNPAMFSPSAYFIVLNAVLSGLVLICLGIVAHYIGTTYDETLGRPLFLVRKMRNLDERTQQGPEEKPCPYCYGGITH